MGHLPESKLLIECGMDKYEVRRLNLRSMIRAHCGDKAASLADKIGRSGSYVSRMLYPEGKAGKKRIGEDMRDLIEEALSLPRGTMDDEEAARAEHEGLPSPPTAGQLASIQELPVQQAIEDLPATETTLERLDAMEKQLLELYRRATSEGKTMIRGAALAVPKTDD